MTPPRTVLAPRLGRRAFLGGLAAGLGGLLLARRRAGADDGQDPHFFLQLVVAGGLDPTYLFDARPLAMTAAGLQVNYLGEEPAEWIGPAGGRTLAASPTAALRPYAADLAIANGVIMSTSFDGHDQNTNLLFTGNPFGGSSFLVEFDPSAPLDYVRLGSIFAELDDSRLVSLSPASARELTTRLRARGAGTGGRVDDLAARYDAASGGAGRFSAGAARLRDAARSSVDLERRLRAVELAAPGEPAGPDGVDVAGALGVAAEYFRRGVVRSAVIDLTGGVQYDAHDLGTARSQVQTYPVLMGHLAAALAYLKATPFDDRRSLLDVTTVMFASEFGRTMRQAGMSIEATGTDHNPLASSVILAGKGVRGGAVLGASDFQAADEVLSPVHLALDPDRLKRMGRPIDFATGLPIAAAPEAYEPDRYLTIASLVNTVMTLFGVDRAHLWSSARDTPAAPVIDALLT